MQPARWVRHVRSAGWTLAVLALAFLAWLAFTGTTSSAELLLGAASSLFCAAASLLTWQAMGISIAVNLPDLLRIWRVPFTVNRDAWIITVVLVKDLLGISRAASHLCAVPFERRSGRRARLRRVLITAYTSISPNSIVIGIDEEQHLVLFHQLARTPISKTMQRLGARP